MYCPFVKRFKTHAFDACIVGSSPTRAVWDVGSLSTGRYGGKEMVVMVTPHNKIHCNNHLIEFDGRNQHHSL